MNKINNIGNNLLKKIDISSMGREILGKDPYEYSILNAENEQTYHLDHLGSMTIFVYSAEGKLLININGNDYEVSHGDVCQINNMMTEIRVSAKSTLLICGSSKNHPSKTGIEIIAKEKVYKVEKPWGHELWLSGENHPNYAFKEIFIKQGTKTSLQYHNFKRETNVLFEGNTYLHYKFTNTPNDEVSDNDIKQYKMNPVEVLDVYPKTLHRLEAITDVLLYETSTPDLDDVIRVSDDANRKDGRIDSEHKV
jgi:mannose-6-phosphate isomerase